MTTSTLTPDLLRRMDAYWRAANYLSVGQIYLYDNPLLRRPLTLANVKRMLLGHWGTTPGQNFIYVHLNRVITKYSLNMIYVSGPGHGGPAVVANNNPIHVDPRVAAAYGYAKCVAHGAILLAMISRIIGTRLPGPGAVWMNQSVEWLHPVFVGDGTSHRLVDGSPTGASPRPAYD